MYNPLVSVIIPVHNGAGTLQRALQSVVDQSYAPLEIIIVDDGSTDGSKRLIRSFIDKNRSQTRLFRSLHFKRNRGVAAARLEATKIATGEYVTALDADDWLEAPAIARYVEATDSGRFDIVAAGLIYDYPDHSVRRNFPRGYRLELESIRMDTLHFTMQAKLIRLSLFRELIAESATNPLAAPFTPGHDCWEDVGAVARVLARRPEVVTVADAWYHYTQHSGSITHSNPDRILNDHLKVTRDLERWLLSEGLADRYRHFLYYLQFISKVKYLRNPRAVLRHPVRRLRQWRDTFPESNRHIHTYCHVAPHHRLLFRAVRLVARLLPSSRRR